ncbi:MAG: glycosyltransferase family 4 protein [Oligoflexia bacterium]|nr:glycosyltransferase family 4 protein [Oligoflexia bacterium]
MRVLFLSHQSEYMYGGEKVTLEYMKELKNNGVEVHFAAPEGLYLEQAKKVVYKTHIVSTKNYNKSLTGLFAYLGSKKVVKKELTEIIRRYRINILHTTSLKAMGYGSEVSDMLPVIWHHHDNLKNNLINRHFVKKLALNSVVIIVPSKSTKESLIELGVEAEYIYILFNGYRAREWSVRKDRQEGKPLKVATIGEISFRKGSDQVPQIAVALLRYPKILFGVEFSFIGDGLSNPSYAEKVKAVGSAMGIKFLGYSLDVKKDLQNIDVLLVPSRQDPLPTVIIEAGLSGVPVVASNVGGIPEMIIDGGNGFLAKTVDDFAKGIATLSEIDNWRLMSSRARALAENRFDISVLSKSLYELYQNILATRSGPKIINE